MNLSVKNAAQLLSVTEKTIYRWIKQDILPTFKISGQYRFNRAELLEWATSRRMGVAAEAFSEPEPEAPLPTLYEAVSAGGIFYRIDGSSRDEALAAATRHLRLQDGVDRQYLEQVLIAREKLTPTAVGDKIAIPHPRSPGLLHLNSSKVSIFFLEHPVDFDALDGGEVEILFVILAASLKAHLHLLSRVGFVLHDEKFREALFAQESRGRIFEALCSAEEKILTKEHGPAI
jgi:PTS system nitrogen regulatory IIA component